MPRFNVKHLLIGGGLASATAARAIRELDAQGSVMLVGQEINGPYHRPPLARQYLRGLQSHQELFAVESDWFSAHGVQLRTGLRAATLDMARRCVTLENAEEIGFQNLLIATGASPRQLMIPGAAAANVHYLRRLEDAQSLRLAADKALREGQPAGDPGAASPCRPGRGRAAVIGGGLLGVELAGTLTQMGLAVDLIVSGSWPWHKLAGANVGALLLRYLEFHGVRVHVGLAPLRLEGEGRAQRVVLPGQRLLPCDFVVVAIGVMPNKDILRGTSIAAERAVLADDHCRTNVAGVWAAGDCAALLDRRFGKHRVMDHWENAQVTGRIAGHNMAGADEAYDHVNAFSSTVFELTVRAWGQGDFVQRRLWRGEPTVESPRFVELGVAGDGRVAQVLAAGSMAPDATLAELVRRRLNVSGIEEAMKDPAVPLESLIK